jgi:hypothetical protein
MEYMSLYDYLGRAAGSELGKQVAAAATRDGIKLQTRQVSNSKYEGAIMLYPSDWLSNYFNPELPSLKDLEISPF